MPELRLELHQVYLPKHSRYYPFLLQIKMYLKRMAKGQIKHLRIPDLQEHSSRLNYVGTVTVTEHGIAGTIDAHLIAIGTVLYCMGFRGQVWLTKNFTLTTVPPTAVCLKHKEITSVQIAKMINDLGQQKL